MGLFGVAVFLVASLFVMAGEFTLLRTSKLVIIAPGFIWGAHRRPRSRRSAPNRRG